MVKDQDKIRKKILPKIKVISFLFYLWAYYSFTLLNMYAFSLIIYFIEVDFFLQYILVKEIS